MSLIPGINPNLSDDVWLSLVYTIKGLFPSSWSIFNMTVCLSLWILFLRGVPLFLVKQLKVLAGKASFSDGKFTWQRGSFQRPGVTTVFCIIIVLMLTMSHVRFWLTTDNLLTENDRDIRYLPYLEFSWVYILAISICFAYPMPLRFSGILVERILSFIIPTLLWGLFSYSNLFTFFVPQNDNSWFSYSKTDNPGDVRYKIEPSLLTMWYMQQAFFLTNEIMEMDKIYSLLFVILFLSLLGLYASLCKKSVRYDTFVEKTLAIFLGLLSEFLKEIFI